MHTLLAGTRSFGHKNNTSESASQSALIVEKEKNIWKTARVKHNISASLLFAKPCDGLLHEGKVAFLEANIKTLEDALELWSDLVTPAQNCLPLPGSNTTGLFPDPPGDVRDRIWGFLLGKELAPGSPAVGLGTLRCNPNLDRHNPLVFPFL